MRTDVYIQAHMLHMQFSSFFLLCPLIVLNMHFRTTMLSLPSLSPTSPHLSFIWICCVVLRATSQRAVRVIATLLNQQPMIFRHCIPRLAVATQAARKNTPALVKKLMASEDINGGKILNTVGPSARSPKATFFISMASLLCFTTYAIMVNWVYEGYVDLWYGVYGLDDEDDE